MVQKKWLLLIVLAFPVAGRCQAPEAASKGSKEVGDQSDFLFKSLDVQLPRELEPGKYKLAKLLETLTELTSSPGSKDDPARIVQFLVNQQEFEKAFNGDYNTEDVSVTLPRLRGATLRTVLRTICNSSAVRGDFLIRRNYIELVPRAYVDEVIRTKDAEEGQPGAPKPTWQGPLVYYTASDESLGDIIQKLQTQTGVTIGVGQDAKPMLEKQISVKLMNVPLEAALEILMQLGAGGKVMRVGNAFVLAAPAAGA